MVEEEIVGITLKCVGKKCDVFLYLNHGVLNPWYLLEW